MTDVSYVTTRLLLASSNPSMSVLTPSQWAEFFIDR
jgi:hypothetical protein